MKYALRTVTWRFHETVEVLPEISSKPSVHFNSPQDVFSNYHSLFDNQVHERFVVFWLSTANKVLGFEIVSEGTLNSSLVHPREVFRGAIVATAASVVLAHNHPSDNPEPSQEDLAITRQLVESSKIIGIPVYDHIIFAGTRYTSLAERGLL